MAVRAALTVGYNDIILSEMHPLQLIVQYYLTFIMPMIIINVNILHLGVLFQQQSTATKARLAQYVAPWSQPAPPLRQYWRPMHWLALAHGVEQASHTHKS